MDLIQTVRKSSLLFLQRLYTGKGFFSYSLSSDIYNPHDNWGLANTVFAAKTYFILMYSDSLDARMKSAMVNFIKGFQRKKGVFSDPLVHKKTLIINKLAAIRNLNFANFFGQKTIMAESRQAIVALLLLGEKPDEPFAKIPYSQKEVDRFLDSLNWGNIWGAASHINHLVFFLKTNADLFDFRKDESGELIEYCLDRIDALQSKDEGMWFKKKASQKQKVNAAMKIISAFNIINKKEIKYAEKIINYILDVKESYYYDACDNLNAMYVLKYAFDSSGKSYRRNDVNLFCEKSIERYKKYIFKDDGGFSFLPNDNPRRYYGMNVTRRFSGPDIHGTMLFTWAVSLAAAILNVNKDSLREVIN